MQSQRQLLLNGTAIVTSVWISRHKLGTSGGILSQDNFGTRRSEISSKAILGY